jgi:phosphinothricin acetyltransferase
MQSTQIAITPAREADLEPLYDLLHSSGLPSDGLSAHLPTTLLARDGHHVVGSAALEIYGPHALLRSVAVDNSLRGQGLGIRLTQAALDHAASLGVTDVFLLTETAADFFPRFGFAPVTRADVPPNVLQSVEFTTLCPDTALVMALHLPGRQSPTLQARPAVPHDAPSIARIYNQGIEDRVATFETRLRTPDDILSWFDGLHPITVVEDNGTIIAFASTSTYRPRDCYSGVAEFSVYTAREARGRGAGRLAMTLLLDLSARAGFWKLISRIFPENTPSLSLMRSLGFRQVGTYQKHAQLDGVWRDVVIVEKLLQQSSP